ncbi:unnamed protein product [Bursaphelenchus xylophilus]|uniref:(pine wood nematode) hypothetical protein n=1 Tax=Bursaphelenchus xylophilus TaxID=6326 RepID=A0A1I7S055_BURXY|nr:unnamed protein product [Bursaphelenchus xylophilus]CAG9109005.1 unnamed protein product [Bursaphelenchus xylophilus]
MVQLDTLIIPPSGHKKVEYYTTFKPKLFGDAALTFAHHFFNFSSKCAYANPQKPDLRFVSINRRTAKWQSDGISGMEAHVMKNNIKFVHNGSLILSVDINMAKKLDILPIQPHKLVIRDLNSAQDVDEIAYHFGRCVSDLHIYPNVCDDLSIRMINQFHRLLDLTIQPSLLSHPDLNTLTLSSLHIGSPNQLQGLFSDRPHNIKSIHVHNPITQTMMHNLDTVTITSPLVLNVEVHKDLLLTNSDLAIYIRHAFPTVQLLKVNVVEYQTNYFVTQNEDTAEILASTPLIQQLRGLGVYVQTTYNRYLDSNRRNVFCYKSAILSNLLSDKTVQVKPIELQPDFQHYRIEKNQIHHSVVCNLYFQGEACCGQHSKYLL